VNNNHENHDSNKRVIRATDIGSITEGFFIGLIVITVSSVVSWLIISVIPPSDAGTATDFRTFLFLAILGFPFLSILCATIWCGWKGKVKTAIGIMTSIAITVISLPLLLIAACFGMFK
jgi:hypothetical protein